MSEQLGETADDVVAFGPFRLFVGRRQLLEGDAAVRLGSRARDILVALVEKPGQVLNKQELLSRVWPDTFVEEASLRVHVAALRRALGDGQAGRRYITNIPGRGYCFVAPLSVAKEHGEVAVPTSREEERAQDRPVPLARMVGRSDVVVALSEQLTRHRFTTVVGPGGIGKTTVAVAVADHLFGSFADGVRFIDLAPLTDPLLVPSTLAALFGVGVRSDNPMPSLIAFLKERHVLIVLDSCEHLIDAAATLAEEIYKGAKRAHILATSREALRAEGERVHRLSPLTFPANSQNLKAADALEFPSVQLFVERAAASLGSFELSDAEAPLVADICRRLDGLALAIEIAASRVDTFGVAGLAAGLDNRFQLLMRGRRTALPRHRTLTATLDWSHAQLPEIEQLVLRHLAVFVGPFTMDSASAILSHVDTSAAETVVDAIANLVAKSLVSADVDGATAFYRLFDVTRSYALTKLEEGGDRDRLARSHAEHYRGVLERAQADWEARPATEWLDLHRHLIDNVRAALDWAFSPAGDPATGVAITVGAVPLWFELSLTSECAERVDLALAAPSASRSADFEMRLYATRAWSLMQTQGSVPATEAAWTRVLELSEQQDNVDHQLRALWGLWAGLLNRSEFRSALAIAERFSELAARCSDNADFLVGERMIGYIVHLMGDQTRARRHIERMLADYETPVTGAQLIRYVFDQRATAQCFLARILWLQGHADQATRLKDDVVAAAIVGNDGLSLCQTLVQGACSVALFTGDLEALDRYVTMLLDYSERQALEFWQAFGRCFRGVLTIKRGRDAEGVEILGAALDELREIQFGVYYGLFLGEYAHGLSRVGRTGKAREAIDQALKRSERNDERWYLPELLRIKGEILLRHRGAGASLEAEREFLESLDWAERQETAGWKLRSAISLARLLHEQQRDAEARAALAPVYAGFDEGFDTADLREARELLAVLLG